MQQNCQVRYIYFWKINLRILWNHIMKNPQVKQGQCDSNMFPQNTFLSMLQVTARPLPCWQQDYLLFLCPNLSQNSISCSAYLWGVLVKNRGGLGIFQILLKKRFSHLSWQPSLLGDNLTMWLFFLHPLVSPRREYTWTPTWKHSWLIYFKNFQDVLYSHEKK